MIKVKISLIGWVMAIIILILMVTGCAYPILSSQHLNYPAKSSRPMIPEIHSRWGYTYRPDERIIFGPSYRFERGGDGIYSRGCVKVEEQNFSISGRIRVVPKTYYSCR